jgi:hypothetical protein
MRTDFSEFSFGYALVEEFANSFRPSITAAPIFPSLIEEGSDGGGYDVKFELPGVPLLIQFKRPDVMLTAKSMEIRDHKLPLASPFYRFHIRSSGKSKQHDLLLDHDNGTKLVYYASPCFYQIHDFDSYYFQQSVIDNTIFVRPQDIGPLSADPHHLAYDSTNTAWRFSDQPSRVHGTILGRGIEDDFRARLKEDRRPFGEGPLKEAVISIENSLSRRGISTVSSGPRLEGLTGRKRELARFSELSQIYLGAQAFVIQELGDLAPDR